VVAVIGTSTKVTPQFGAAMLRALGAASESALRTKATPLAVLFRRAQKQLFDTAIVEGLAPTDVLTYTLLGHAGVRICTPAASAD
jgi:hypothetical protein